MGDLLKVRGRRHLSESSAGRCTAFPWGRFVYASCLRQPYSCIAGSLPLASAARQSVRQPIVKIFCPNFPSASYQLLISGFQSRLPYPPLKFPPVGRRVSLQTVFTQQAIDSQPWRPQARSPVSRVTAPSKAVQFLFSWHNASSHWV